MWAGWQAGKAWVLRASNGAFKEADGVRDQGTIDQLRNAKQRRRYGAATVTKALDRCGALSYLRSDLDLFCQNRVFSNELRKMIQAALDDPGSPGLEFQLHDPLSGAIRYVSV